MPSSHLILCRPLLLLPPIPPSIRIFSNESTLRMRWPKHWSCSFIISPFNEHPGLIFPSSCIKRILILLVDQFSSVAQSCPTPCDPMNCSTPGLPIQHQLPEFTQIHVHRFMALGDIKKDQFRFHSFAKCRPFWSNTVRAISSGLLFA